MDDFRHEFAALRALIDDQKQRMDEQQQQISELKNRIAEGKATDAGCDDDHPTRRGLLAGALAAVAGGAALVSSSPAEAADNLVLGSTSNTASQATGLTFTGAGVAGNYGLGATDHGLGSFPVSATIAGHVGANYTCAVLGYDNGPGAYGIYGRSEAGTGVHGEGIGGQTIGVWGEAYKWGVLGLAKGSGVNSIGVLAQAAVANATALVVKGVLRATRAGRATIPAGVRIKSVSLSPLTGTALVLATVQKVSGNIAVQAVTVKTTSPTSFTITLNANAPPSGMPVAWFVVDAIGAALS